jgi:hypothetical protein
MTADIIFGTAVGRTPGSRVHEVRDDQGASRALGNDVIQPFPHLLMATWTNCS